MAEVGSAFVSILPSAKGFGSKLNSQVSGDIDKAGKSTGRRFGSAMKAGALAIIGGGALAVGFLRDSVDLASDLNESGSKIDAIFGKQGAAAVESFAAQGATALGQTKLAVLDASATFGTFGKAAGLGGKELARFSTGFASLSTDLASFHNSSPEEAVEAIGAALRGEAEPIRRFGVLLDDATLKNEALKLGLIKTTKNALTPQQKVLAAQAAIYKQTADAQGDFQRTSGGLANQQRILAAQWSDMKATVGAALLPAVTSFVTTLNTRVVPAVTGFIAGMRSGAGAGGAFVAALRSMGATLATVGGFLSRNRDYVIPLVAALAAGAVVFKTMAVVTRLWAAAQAVLNVALTANPIGLVIAAIAGLAVGLVVAYKRSETFRNVVNKAFAGVRAVVSAVMPAITAVVRAGMAYIQAVIKVWAAVFRGDWSGAWAAAKSILTAAWNAIKGAVQAGISALMGVVRGLPGKIKSGLGSLGTLLYSAGLDLIRGLINGIKAMAGQVASAAANVVGSAVDAAKRRLGIQSPSKVFRQIGVWVGKGLEDGLEARVKAVQRVGGILAAAVKGGFEGKDRRVSAQALAGIEELVSGLRKKGVEAIGPVFDKLREKVAGFATAARDAYRDVRKAAREFASSVAATYKNDLFNKTISTPFGEVAAGVGGLRLQLEADRNDAQSMFAALTQAASKGLSGPLFTELAQSKDLHTAQQLAALSSQEIADLERLYAQRNKATQQVGDLAAQKEYAAELRELRAEMKQTRQVLNSLPREVREGTREGTREGMDERDRRGGQRAKAGR